MKRLPNIIRLLLLICAAAVISDCAKIPELHEREAEPDSRVSLSVEEARQYFESEYGTLSVTKTVNGEARVPWLMPGDITPMWEKAVESWKGNTASVDVEVIPTYRYRAVRSEFRDWKAEAYSVDVYQKLVVVKKHDDETGEDRMGQYILTLIPDKGYDRSHRGNVVERFINTGDKGSYSGLAVYFCGGLPMRLDRYEGGEKTGWISAFGTKDTQEFVRRVNMICRELGKIKFLRGRAVQTKYGEDIWDDGTDGDWDYGSMDGYTDMGDGIYQDSEGDYYIDWDGDGNIDSFYIMPEEPVEPDEPDWPDPIEEDEPDPDWPPIDTGDGDDGGMTDYDWDSGWSPDGGSSNKPDKPEGGEDDEEAIALGRQGVSKMAGDLRSGNVNCYKAANGALTGIGTAINANGIITSAVNFVDSIDKSIETLCNFGTKLSIVGAGLSVAQTILVVTNEDEFGESEILSLVSAALGVAAVFLPPFSIAAGVVGISSCVVGLIATGLSSYCQPGMYIIPTQNGLPVYIYVGNYSWYC